MMPRFELNRRWTFILALGVSLLWCSAAFRTVAANDSEPGGNHDPGESGGGGQPGYGDPDVPTGPGKTVKPVIVGRGHMGYGARAAGDGGTSGGVLMQRLRIVLQGLRSFYFRF